MTILWSALLHRATINSQTQDHANNALHTIDLGKLKRRHPNGGAKCRWGRLRLATFDKITRYNSKTSTLNLCLQHVYRYAARCVGSSAADTCSYLFV